METITRYELVTTGSAWSEWFDMVRAPDGDWVLHEDRERIVADRDAHIRTLQDTVRVQADQLAAAEREITRLRECCSR